MNHPATSLQDHQTQQLSQLQGTGEVTQRPGYHAQCDNRGAYGAQSAEPLAHILQTTTNMTPQTRRKQSVAYSMDVLDKVKARDHLLHHIFLCLTNNAQRNVDSSMYMVFLDIVLKHSAKGKIDSKRFVEDVHSVFGEKHPELFREITAFATPLEVLCKGTDVSAASQGVVPSSVEEEQQEEQEEEQQGEEEDVPTLVYEDSAHAHEESGLHHETFSVHEAYYGNESGHHPSLPKYKKTETAPDTPAKYNAPNSPVYHDKHLTSVAFMYRTLSDTDLVCTSTSPDFEHTNEGHTAMYPSNMLRITPTQYSAITMPGPRTVTNGQLDMPGYTTTCDSNPFPFSGPCSVPSNAALAPYPKVGAFGIGDNPTSRELLYMRALTIE
jgi:hypothetical protein